MSECAASLAGLTSMCAAELSGGECCNGVKTLHQRVLEMDYEDADLVRKAAKRAEDRVEGGPAAPIIDGPAKGHSGYIHPDAWLGSRDIGSLADVTSTGRKRVARMYPITPGQVCEWAGKKNCGGGVNPVMGCLNNPATDLHHGPDKNTLNNEKGSRGVGEKENVHVICAECHNMWHAANDPLYPPYDRQEQQAEPWLPEYPEGHQHLEPEDADLEELLNEERRREEQRRKRGRENRGRNAAARSEGDFSVDDD